jgi:parallel beta-helix repeat protein
MRKTATYFLFGLLLFGSFGLLAQTMMPIPPHASAFTANPRGFWFVAPTDFIITGLRVPTEASTAPQSVQLVRFAAVSQPGNYTTLAHFGSVPGTGILPVNEIINTGDVIGILGVRDVSTNSYGTGSFPTTILGLPVTLERLWINGQQINTAPVTNAMTLATTSQITRVEMYYTPLGPCVSPPFAGNTQANPATVCINNPTSLSVDSVTMGQGSSFQWQVSTDNVNWSNMVGDTLPIASAIVSNATQWHRLENTCGGVSTFSTPVQVFGSGTPLAAGTYTINSLSPTGGTNFTNFTDFFQAVECGGISGPIVLNVVSGTGPYVEHVRATNIGNTSAINSITINGNGEVLEFSNTDNLQRATLTLDGSSFITIDGLVIRALATGSVGYGIHLTNGANNNVIKNCQIEIPQTTTSANFAGIVSNTGTTAIAQGGNFPFENTIENNVITGGYYGVTLIGGGSANRASGNKVLNNTLHEYYFYGIYSHSQEDFEYIGNDMARPSRTTLSSFYGIFCTQEHHGGTIAKNAIHDPFGQVSSTSLIYAMYSTNASGTANKPNHVYNNIFYNLENNGTLYGIWNASSSHWKYYHNSIDIDDLNPTAGLTYAFYLSGNSDDVEFINNIISLRRAGTSAKYAVYVLGSGNRTINNNGYFVDYAVGNTNFGFLSSAYATFPDWRNGNPNNWDNLSVFDNPNFLFAPGGILEPASGALDNIGQNLLSIVPTDYRDSARTITPDPGAFEFQGPLCANPVAFDTTGITSTSISLAWGTPGQTNTWDIEWGPVGFTPGTVGSGNVTTTNNPYTITGLTPGACYDIYIRANCTNLNLGIGAWVGPISSICLPYDHDIALDGMTSPAQPTGCGDSAMAVSVIIFNNGSLPATNFSLQALVTGAYTATLNTTYTTTLQPGAFDTVVIGTLNTFLGGTITVDVTVNYALDQNSTNNDLSFTNIQIVPGIPQFTDPGVVCSLVDSVDLEATPIPGVGFNWWDASQAGNLLSTGPTFRVPTANPGPYWLEYAVGGGKDSLETEFIGSTTTTLAGAMFDVNILKDIFITSFDVHPGGSGPTDVHIYFKTGSFLGSENDPSAWTLVEVVPNVQFTGALTQVRVPLTNALQLNQGQLYGIYIQPISITFRYSSGAAAIPPGQVVVQNQDLQILGSVAKGGANPPFGTSTLSPRLWNGRINYRGPDGCESPRVPVTFTAYSDTAVADFTFTQTGPGDFSFDATNSTGHQYDWDFGDLNTAMGISTSHSYVTSGSYNVTLIVTDTVCNTTDSMTVAVTSTVSLEEFLIEQSLRVFPNPSRDVFHIEFEMEGTRDMYLRVLSPTGQLIMQEHTGRTGGIYKKTINLGTMAKGVYILQVQTENGIVSRRLTLM